MSIAALTEKDLGDLAVGVDVGVDYVALSFVQRPEDIAMLKRALALGQPICRSSRRSRSRRPSSISRRSSRSPTA